MNENSQPSTDKKSRPFPWLNWLGIGGLFLASWIASTALLWINFDERLVAEEFIVGEPSPRTVYAGFELEYPNLKATQDLKEHSVKSVLPVYRIQSDLEKEAFRLFNRFFMMVENFVAAPVPVTGAKPLPPEMPFNLSKATQKIIFESADWRRLQSTLRQLLQTSFARGIFEPTEKQKILESGFKEITVLKTEGVEANFASSELLTSEDPKKTAELFLDSDFQKNKPLKGALLELWSYFCKPNVKRDDSEMDQRQKKAADSVSLVMAKVKKNELVAQQGILVTPDEKERLSAIGKIMTKRESVNRLLGISILSFIFWFLTLIAYQLFFRAPFVSKSRYILFHLAVFLTLASSKSVLALQGASPYLMPTALASLLLVLLLGSREALLAAFGMTLFAGPLSGNRVEVVLATLVASGAAILTGLKIRKRIQFLKIGTAVAFSYFAVFFIHRLFSEASLDAALQLSSPGLVNGLLITVSLAFILVPILESLFNLTTDVTLLEMSDLNHPLLKRMIVEAPGTYHHSLVVSTLAESACEAIGANALLARVGCYFHDIGKIARAEFFTENQHGPSTNRHENLSPKMSSIIIMNHVKEGIDLGIKYKLKKPILNFIPEHQGTAVVYYFYRKALEEVKPGEIVDMNQFRYPGPKPQSRETAVALLSDSVEAASRSLKEYSPDSIGRLVRKIINDKFIDGQLDECDLTLKDLHEIQKSFVHNLMAIFHTRVVYPEKPQQIESTNLFPDSPESSKLKNDSFRSQL